MDSTESSRKRINDHFCALKTSKRCAFCEIDFNKDESDDSKLKLTKSFELFEGIVAHLYLIISFKINSWHFSEAKKVSFAVVKVESSRLKNKLDNLIEKQQEKLEMIASQSDKLSIYIKEFEKYCLKFSKFKW